MKSFFILLIMALFSFGNRVYAQLTNNVKIVRVLTAKSGYQVIEFENAVVKNIASKRPALSNNLDPKELDKLITEFQAIDREKLTEEFSYLPDLEKTIYPRIYYQFIEGNTTFSTKEFIISRIPTSLKKFDKLFTSLAGY